MGLIVVVLSVLGWGCAKDNPASSGAPDGSAKYVGVAACKPCHQGTAKGRIYETWVASAHARAFESLWGGYQSNPLCLRCHTTGFGCEIARGKSPEDLRAVQCEACHGPGSEYKALAAMKNRTLAIEKGLVVPDALTCARCHSGAFPQGHIPVPPFDYATALARIEHHMRPPGP
jgi:hypothetical protein